MRIGKIVLMLTLLALAACAAPTAPTPEATPSATVRPSLTPPPTALPPATITPRPTPPTPTSTQTATPSAPLQTDGPYLVYLRGSGADSELVFMDPDGAGRTLIPYPYYPNRPNGESPIQPGVSEFISPDGRWLAYHTGTPIFAFETPDPGAGIPDIALNIYNLETGETRLVAHLLSNNYPSIFQTAVPQIDEPYVDAESLEWAFLAGIAGAFNWSPDSRYLAFAGQMDGNLSSDLYVYDTVTWHTRRLTSGPEELVGVTWSPDGQWILYFNTVNAGMGVHYKIYAVTLGGQLPRLLSEGEEIMITWLDGHRYLQFENENGPGTYGIRLVDIETGANLEVWPGSFRNWAVGRSGNWVAVWGETQTPGALSDPDFTPGLYLVNLYTLERTFVHAVGESYYIAPFDFGDQEFLADFDGLHFLSTDGTLTPTEFGDGRVFMSHDGGYWLIIRVDTIQVYSRRDGFIREVSSPAQGPYGHIYDVIWSSNSMNVFFPLGQELYALSLLEGSANLVDDSWARRGYDFVENAP